MATRKGWSIRHLDIKMAYLNGDLKEEAHMELPQGLILSRKQDQGKVCLLRKTIYGLKQASRAWYIKIHVFLIDFGMVISEADHNLYFCREGKITMIILIYVDDLLITGNHTACIEALEQKLENRFEMSKLGPLTFYIGIEFTRLSQGMLLLQRSYVMNLLEKFDMKDCAQAAIPMEDGLKLHMNMEGDFMDTTNYQSLVGSLIYLTHTRPNISYFVSCLSRFMSTPQRPHLDAGMLLHGSSATSKQPVVMVSSYQLPQVTTMELQGFVDLDWGRDLDKRRSTSGLLCNKRKYA